MNSYTTDMPLLHHGGAAWWYTMIIAHYDVFVETY